MYGKCPTSPWVARHEVKKMAGAGALKVSPPAPLLLVLGRRLLHVAAVLLDQLAVATRALKARLLTIGSAAGKVRFVLFLHRS